MLVEIGDGQLRTPNPQDPEGEPRLADVRVVKLKSVDGVEVQAVLTLEQAEQVGEWLKSGTPPRDPASGPLGNGGPVLLG